MTHITSENKIIISDYSGETYEIINNTDYLPLSVYADTILMSDGKLYYINKNYTLRKFELGTGEDYVVDAGDFTDEFVKINLKYHRILDTLCEMPIIAKNSRNIKNTGASLKYNYCYVDTDNNLVLIKKDRSTEILDYDVDLIIFVYMYGSDGNVDVTYKKNDIIICSTHDSSSEITVCNINYDGSAIVKILGKYMLDSDGYLYIFKPADKTITKILDKVIDFNWVDSELHILDLEHKLYSVNPCNNNLTYIDDSSYFKKIKINTKSSNNLYR